MVTFPISLKRCDYRGSNARKLQECLKRNRMASELEDYINHLLDQQVEAVKSYFYDEISQATGYSADVVRDLCRCIDFGSGGFTATRKGLPAQQALALHGDQSSANAQF